MVYFLWKFEAQERQKRPDFFRPDIFIFGCPDEDAAIAVAFVDAYILQRSSCVYVVQSLSDERIERGKLTQNRRKEEEKVEETNKSQVEVT